MLDKHFVTPFFLICSVSRSGMMNTFLTSIMRTRKRLSDDHLNCTKICLSSDIGLRPASVKAFT